MLMTHFEEPKVTEDEEPATEQDKRKKLVSLAHVASLKQVWTAWQKRKESMWGGKKKDPGHLICITIGIDSSLLSIDGGTRPV